MNRLVFALLVSALLPGWAVAQVTPTQPKSQPTRFKPTFTNQTELGVLFGRVTYGPATNEVSQKRTNLTFQTFNGLQLTPKFAAGAVVGVDWYDGEALLPLGGGVRYDFAKTQKNVRLYGGFDGGYSVNWLASNLNGSKATGGLFASPTVGMRFGRPDRSNFTLAFSYRYQRASIAYQPDNYFLRRSEERTYSRASVRVGVSF